MSPTDGAGPALRRDGEVFLLDLGDGDNTFNPTWMEAVEEHLATVEQTEGPRALVTLATGKFWSNGLDLQYLSAHQAEVGEFVDRVHRLFATVLGAGVGTVAAVSGHAFAAGAMLAVCHDQLVRRADRGFWSVPEVDLRLAFTPGMTALLQARLPQRTAHEAMTTGRRYGGVDAVRVGLADEAVIEPEVLSAAVGRARSLAGKDPATLRTIKHRLYGEVLAALRAPGQMSASEGTPAGSAR